MLAPISMENKLKILESIYSSTIDGLNRFYQVNSTVAEYDYEKADTILNLVCLPDIEFTRFLSQVASQGFFSHPYQIARLASLYDFNMALASYQDRELDVLIEATKKIPNSEYPMHDLAGISLFRNREVLQNIMKTTASPSMQIDLVESYLDGALVESGREL